MELNRIYLGIDASKGYADLIFYTSKKVKLEKGFQLDDNIEGHQILKSKLREFIDQGYQIICGIENTDGYQRNWVHAIRALSEKLIKRVEIYRLNPKAVKHPFA